MVTSVSYTEGAMSKTGLADTIGNKSLSVLANVSTSHLVMEPFPHIVVNNPLPPAYYQELSEQFPSIDCLKKVLRQACLEQPQNKSLARSLRHLKRSNKRVNIPSKVALSAANVPLCWKDFLEYHSSNLFLQDLLTIFRPAIAELYPSFPIDEAVARRRGESGDTELTMDAMLALNTPSWRRGEITGPHTDHPRKLFVGLYYLREPKDTAGGNLILYRRKETATEKNLKWPDLKTVEEVFTVDYEPNTLVILLNGPNSVHGVTTRLRSRYPRRFVNFIVENRNPLYKVPAA